MDIEQKLQGEDRQSAYDDDGQWPSAIELSFDEDSLDGIPLEILLDPGCLDRDHAGGCG